MYAPQIDSFKYHYHREEYSLDKKSAKLLDRLYSLISEIEPCGDDERRTVWIRAARGTLDDYGDYEILLADGEVTSREQFGVWIIRTNTITMSLQRFSTRTGAGLF